MDVKDVVVIGLLLVLALEGFAIWLEARWDRLASESSQRYFVALYTWAQAFNPPHRSTFLPAVAASASGEQAPAAERPGPLEELTRLSHGQARRAPDIPPLGEDEETRVMERLPETRR